MNIYLSIGEADKHFLRKSIKSRLRVYNIGKTFRKKNVLCLLKEKNGKTLVHHIKGTKLHSGIKIHAHLIIKQIQAQ